MGLIEIDGSYGEGGGQVLRTAVGLSAATGRACRVRNVRKGRSNPGLAAQHLQGVRAVARTCDGELEGDEKGSTEVEFRPEKLDPPRSMSVDIGTAGSVTLLLQALMIPLQAAGRTVEVQVRGGTHVKWSPTADYFAQVFAWFLGRMGTRVRLLEVRPGFYPKGGGLLRLEVQPGPLAALNLTRRDDLETVSALSIASEKLRDARVAERQLEGVRQVLEPDRQSHRYVGGPSVGTAVLAWADYGNCRLGASALGERGKPAETVGAEAAVRLRDQMETPGCLDRHMADQILPYLPMAEGDSEVRMAEVTGHCRTCIWVIEQFLPARFEADEGAGLIACRP
ncbi:MAG: RNA 3'-terminal phosphate cyclase [Planctomycetota bacterium]